MQSMIKDLSAIKSDCCIKTFLIEENFDEKSVAILLRQVEAAFDQGSKHFFIDLSRTKQISICGKLALQTITARAAELGGEAVFSSNPFL